MPDVPSTPPLTPTLPEDVPTLQSRLPAHQQAGYDAVYAVIRSTPGDAWRNALIWRAVEAYRTAAEPKHDRWVREQVAAEDKRDRSDALNRVIAVIEGYECVPWDVPVPVSLFRKAVEGRR
ncbi:hypothetical protein [Actinomadura rubrisoli]|uniref:Uncharacterized protein n=1 Tax=Actinomadura rubrisoli TaxID=2530368 RepID=A0A4R5CJN4_9ACTN|nr:hypothetical protein [Actinomadura rubrisoli]TDD97604.1 hypothetical protein E1298_00815 [Actinomadura rubrisoli]